MNQHDEDTQIRFLLAAIEDAQAINKAIDAKVTALFIGLAIPLTRFAHIWIVCKAILTTTTIPDCIPEIAVLTFSVSWVVSVWAAFRTLSRMQNPKEFVVGRTPHGSFFGGTLFQVNRLEALLGGNVANKADFERHFQALPETCHAIRRELAFEHMKVVFIRSVKMERLNIAYAAFMVWLVAGGLIWSSYLVSQR